MKPGCAAGPFKAATGDCAAVGTDRSTASDGIPLRPGDCGPGGRSAARAFVRAVIHVEIVPAELLAASEVVEAFIGRQSQKAVELAAIG